MTYYYFFFQAEDGIRDLTVTGVQTCALPISLETVRVLPELVGHLARVRLGQREARRLDGDDDLIGVGELPGVLGVALHVGAAAGEQVLSGRDERELLERIDDARRGEEQRDDDGEGRPGGGDLHQSPERAAGSQDDAHPTGPDLILTADEPLEALPREGVRPLLRRGFHPVR